jgi:hypothetical protein
MVLCVCGLEKRESQGIVRGCGCTSPQSTYANINNQEFETLKQSKGQTAFGWQPNYRSGHKQWCSQKNQTSPMLSRNSSVVFHSSAAISGSCAFSEGFITFP